MNVPYIAPEMLARIMRGGHWTEAHERLPIEPDPGLKRHYAYQDRMDAGNGCSTQERIR